MTDLRTKSVQSSTQSLKTSLKEIQALIAEKDWDRSLDLSTRLIQQHHKNRYVNDVYAKSLWGLGRKQDAISHLEAIWVSDKGNEYALEALCRMFADNQDLDRWIAFASNIDLEQVKNSFVLAVCGELFHGYGHEQKRDQVIRRIGNLPLSFRSAVFVADVLFSLGRIDEGVWLIARVQKEMVLEPIHHLALFRLKAEHGLPVEDYLPATQAALQGPNIEKGVAWAAFAIRKFRKPTDLDTEGKRFLFVSGTPRSGTTALGLLLGRSAQMGVFIERFDFRYGYHPAMFSLQHLTQGNYSTHPKRFRWEAMVKHYSSLRYVGDKRPHFLKSWYITSRNFDPELTGVLHIHRDLEEVALSYDKRARKSLIVMDGWTPRRDFRVACLDWNLSNQLLVKALQDQKWRRSFLVVRYRDVFGSLESAARIFDWLGVELSVAERADISSFINHSRTMLEAPRELEADKVAYLKTHIDQFSADAVEALCTNLQALPINDQISHRESR